MGRSKNDASNKGKKGGGGWKTNQKLCEGPEQRMKAEQTHSRHSQQRKKTSKQQRKGRGMAALRGPAPDRQVVALNITMIALTMSKSIHT